LNFTILVSHESDDLATATIKKLASQVRSQRLAMFGHITVAKGLVLDLDLWECDWYRVHESAERRAVRSILADIGVLNHLRLVALASSIEGHVADELAEAHEALDHGCVDTFARTTTRIATARIGIVGRRDPRPHARFFSSVSHHNLIVMPYDRLDDAMAADTVSSEDSELFATHSAVDVGSLCGLWEPMHAAPIDRGLMGRSNEQQFGIRMVQSRVRSLQAPTVSLQELFGEQLESLPVPRRYVPVAKLKEDEIDALVEALIVDADGFSFSQHDEEKLTIDGDTLLEVLKDVAVSAIKEAPSALASLIRGEVDTIIQLALQEVVDPEGEVEVVSTLDFDSEDYSFDVLNPWEQARLTDELTAISPAAWTKLVDRTLAVIGGDPSADDIRAKALGGSDRVPVGRRDLLDGLESLPGALPRLALGDGSLSVLGRAKRAEMESPERFAAPFLADDLLVELRTNWEPLVDLLMESNRRLAEALSQTTPIDWSGNVLTFRFSGETDARARRSLERLDSDAAIKAGLTSIIGTAPVLINWIGPEDEFRAMIVPSSTSAGDGQGSVGHAAPQSRAGLLVRIGERILEERSKAESYLEDLTSRLETLGSGLSQHRVQPAIYGLMALGFAGLLFEFLTSPLGERALRILPESAGSGALYAPIVVAAVFAAGALIDVGGAYGAFFRFVVALGSWVFVTSIVLVFGVRWSPPILVLLHASIGAFIAIAWFQTIETESEFRRRLVRLAGALYGVFLVVITAVLTNRGFGPLGLLPDAQTQLRVGVVIQWTSNALLIGGFLVLIINRGRARVQLKREMRSLGWLKRELVRAQEAYETLGLAYVQWNVTACSLAQVVRQPYGPLVRAAQRPDNEKLEGVRRAIFANLSLTKRGEDVLRNEIRHNLVSAGWLKQRYEVRVEAFLALEAERQEIEMEQAREIRPEVDHMVASPEELSGQAVTRSLRLRFAELGDQGVFDDVSAAPIADEALLELLSPVLRDAESQRITGGPTSPATAFDFLAQAGPSKEGPSVPADEVIHFSGRLEVDRSMSQLLWWPKFLPTPRGSDIPAEETEIRWIGGGPAQGSTSVQLLAVRVDYSPLYEYATLRFGIDDDQVAEHREIFDRPSENGVLG
jgi:hypothetical protein